MWKHCGCPRQGSVLTLRVPCSLPGSRGLSLFQLGVHARGSLGCVEPSARRLRGKGDFASAGRDPAQPLALPGLSGTLSQQALRRGKLLGREFLRVVLPSEPLAGYSPFQTRSRQVTLQIFQEQHLLTSQICPRRTKMSQAHGGHL